MVKFNNIIYWTSTIWLSLGMLSSGVVQLLGVSKDVQFIHQLGYPGYLLTLMGIWKILGVVTLLLPGHGLLKEWAYAGFFFLMSGAVFSHVASGSAAHEIFPPLLLLVLSVVSWYFRPSQRKIFSHPKQILKNESKS